MAKNTKYHIDTLIDNLTSSIENLISGDSFQTEVLRMTTSDLKTVTKKNGWNFNWNAELKLKDRQLYKLTIKNNENIIQGLVSLTKNEDHVYVHLVESAPFNQGKKKL